jgi:hypothetical protein
MGRRSILRPRGRNPCLMQVTNRVIADGSSFSRTRMTELELANVFRRRTEGEEVMPGDQS